MLHRKFIPIEEYKNFSRKGAFLYFFKKDEELKDDKITDENESNIIDSIDFINCKTFHDRDST